jgi:hypothetical protein
MIFNRDCYTCAVLGRGRRRNERGIYSCAALEQKALVTQQRIDLGKKLLSQPVRLKQMAKSQNSTFIRQSAHANGYTYKLPVRRHIMQRLLHG